MIFNFSSKTTSWYWFSVLLLKIKHAFVDYNTKHVVFNIWCSLQVRARSEIGYSLYSRQTAFRTKPGHSSSSPIYYNDDDALPNGDATRTSTYASAVDPWPNTNRNRVVVVLAVSGSLLIITVSALIFICGWKKRSPKKNIDEMEKYPGFINNSGKIILFLFIAESKL